MNNFRDKRREREADEEARDQERQPPPVQMFGFLVLVQVAAMTPESAYAYDVFHWEPATFGVAPDADAMCQNAQPGYPGLTLKAILLHEATVEQLSKGLAIFQAQQIIGAVANAGRRVVPVGRVQ